MKKVCGLKILIPFLILIFLNSSPVSAEYISAASGNGSATTTATSFSAPPSGQEVASATVNLAAADEVLVVATFTCKSGTPTGLTRYGNFRLTDGTSSTNSSFRRYLSGTNDDGVGQIVYIFNGTSGNNTYYLQHYTSNSGRPLVTAGTIVAVPLRTSGGNGLANAKAETSSVFTTSSTSFTYVTGTEIAVNLPATGGFYVAASLNSISAAGNTIGVWRLEYQEPGGSTWSPVGYQVSRSMSNTSDVGIVCLNGLLQSQVTTGNYKFRVAAKSLSGVNIGTNYVNIVGVALGVSSTVRFYAFKADDTGITTTSTSLVNAVAKNDYIPYGTSNNDLFLHATYAMNANKQTIAPIYDLYVVDTTADPDVVRLDSRDQLRALSNANDYGSGGSVGLATGLTQNNTHTAALRHATAGTATLKTNAYLVGINLNSDNTIPVTPCPTEPPQTTDSESDDPGADNALYFNGSNNYVSVNDNATLDLSSTWSMECWVRPGLITGIQGLISKGTGASIFLNGDKVQVYYDGSSRYTSATALTRCKYYHIAVTFEDGGAELNVYIDGVLDGNSPASVTAPTTNATSLYIGRGDQGGTTYYYAGTLDEVRIWKGHALSQIEVRDWMCKKVTSSHPARTPTNYMTGYWKFDEDTGTSCTDSSGSGNTGTAQNMTDAVNRVCSAAPIGDASAYDYDGSSPGDFSANLEYWKETDDMTATGDGGTWSNAAKSGLQVYCVEWRAHPDTTPLPWGSGYILDPFRYWGVFVTGGTSPTYTVEYDYNGHQGIIASSLKLAYRFNAIDLQWKALGATLNTGTTSLMKTGETGTEYILGGSDTGPDPLTVILVSFTSKWSDDDTSIRIEWETATEVDHAGFNVLRADSYDGEYDQINVALIPAEGSDTEGHIYQYEDTHVTYGRDYWYKLEAVDQSNESTFYGPNHVAAEGDSDNSGCFIKTLMASP